MSWKDRIENVELTITTGDGKVYKPLWKNSIKTKKYNTTGYNFIGVDGTFVDRKKPQGGKYPLILWFQGDDNIEQAASFEDSAADSRPWEVKHPFYGNIVGQPISLERDDSNYNSTQITVEFWESIGGDFPNTETSIEETVKSKTAKVAETAAKNYEAKNDATFGDIKTLQDSILLISGSFKKLLDDSNFAEYKLEVDKALKTANDVVAAPLQVMQDIQQLSLLPSLYISTIQGRLESLSAAYLSLGGLIDTSSNKTDKLYFEANGATIVAAMCQASVTPLDGDYTTSSEIEKLTVLISSTLEDYLVALDSFQVNIGESLNVFIPDDVAQIHLQDLVAEATANLFKLAFDAKQERRVVVTKGTNLILLTHRYMGLDVRDKNLEEFRQVNDIKNDELFFIKKDRIIKYFV